MASNNDSIRVRFLATFRVEAGEHLKALAANLLALERGVSDEESSWGVQL